MLFFLFVVVDVIANLATAFRTWNVLQQYCCVGTHMQQNAGAENHDANYSDMILTRLMSCHIPSKWGQKEKWKNKRENAIK